MNGEFKHPQVLRAENDLKKKKDQLRKLDTDIQR